MSDIAIIRRLELASRTLVDAAAPAAGIDAARRTAGEVAADLHAAAASGPGPYTESQVRVLERGATFLEDVAGGGRFDDNRDRTAMIEAMQGALLLGTAPTRLEAGSGRVLLDVDALTAVLPKVDANTGTRPGDVLRLAAAGRALEGIVPASSRAVESGMGLRHGAVPYAVDGLATLERDVAALHPDGSRAPVVRDIGPAAISSGGVVSESARAASFANDVASVRSLGDEVPEGRLTEALTQRLVELQPSVRLHHGKADQLVEAVWNATGAARLASAKLARTRAAAADDDPVERLVDRAWGSAPPVGMHANYRTTSLSWAVASGTPEQVAAGVDAIVGSFEETRPLRVEAMRTALATGTAAASRAGDPLPARLRNGAAAVEHALEGYDGPGHRITTVNDYVVQLRGLVDALESTDPQLRAVFAPDALDRTYAELARANESLVSRGTDYQLAKYHLWPDRAQVAKSLVDARLLADMQDSLAATLPGSI